MDKNCFYRLNDRGRLRHCSVEEVLEVMQRPAFRDFQKDGIDRLFRASDYLISPVASPEKFLQGQYFLTNQQFDFRRKILEHLRQKTPAPVISISGITGTGKTLSLFDLAMQLSRKQRILLVHSGKLRRGHMIINERLKNVDIRSAENAALPETLSGYAALLIDEADHLAPPALSAFLSRAAADGIPVIFTYDPHSLLNDLWQEKTEPDTQDRMAKVCTLSLAFTGNIRINRPVYAFLRTLLFLKDHGGYPDYSCIDVLYAGSEAEQRQITSYYRGHGYEHINCSGSRRTEDSLIAQEYDRVLIILNETYYYDDTLHLRVRSESDTPLRLLYEGLSRTREKLCLLVTGNPPLFSKILGIKLHRPA